MAVPALNEISEQGLDLSPDISSSPTLAKDEKHDGSNLPCGAWWKRRAASLYAHAKEANTFWSIFIAAAVMGLVLLGQRWQQERWQALQLKWQISINDGELMMKVGWALSEAEDWLVIAVDLEKRLKEVSPSNLPLSTFSCAKLTVAMWSGGRKSAEVMAKREKRS
uniref:Uncharacterized protein n=1 Tax=Fagus sylvatica TaxID=28930 RepID=A0A2N9F0C0_FAGSY